MILKATILVGAVKRIGPKGFGYIDGESCGVEGDIFFSLKGHHSVRAAMPMPHFVAPIPVMGEIKVGDHLVFSCSFSDEHKKWQATHWCRRADWDVVEAESAEMTKQAKALQEANDRIAALKSQARQILSTLKFRGFMKGKTTSPSLVGSPEQVANGLRFVKGIVRWQVSRDDGKTWQDCAHPFFVATSEVHKVATTDGLTFHDLVPAPLVA